MTNAEKWYEEKIATFTKEKEAIAEITAKIDEYEKMIEKLRGIKRNEFINGAVVFNCKQNEPEGDEPVKNDMLSFNLENEDDIKLLDDIRCLMVFEIQKRIGKLKEERDMYDRIVMCRADLLTGISNK